MRSIVLFIAVVCCFSLCNVVYSDAGGSCGPNLRWSMSNFGDELIIQGEGKMDDYYFNGGNCPPWLDYRLDITTIIVHEGVTSIGNEAFFYLINASRIDLPKSLTSIGSFSFGTMRKLEHITIPGNVNSIGEWAFSGCDILSTVTIENGVESIREFAFDSCYALNSINLPNSIKSIEKFAFSHCNFSTFTIPSGLTSVSSGSFEDCKNLESFQVEAGSKSFKAHEGVLYNLDMTALIAFPPAKCREINSFTVPNTVSTIAEYAFLFSHLTTIILPAGLTTIGEYSFYGCGDLTEISIPESVTSIQLGAFSDCVALTSFDFPSKIKSVSEDVFFGSKSLTSVSIPEGVESIGNLSFSGTSLLSISIPKSVKRIGSGAFSFCNITEVVIPDGIVSIEANTFSFCSKLRTVTLPRSVTSIGNSAFSNCAISSITIPDKVNYIGNTAFSGCTLLSTINIPDGVTSLEYNVFGGCASLKTLILPDSLTSIGSNAFSGCYGLTDIIIPASVETIGDGAFSGCYSLTSMTIPDGVASIGRYCFDGYSLTTVFYQGTLDFDADVFSYPVSNINTVCVGPSYNSSQFCGLKLTPDKEKCRNFKGLFNQCYAPVFIQSKASFIMQKMNRAITWENKISGCVERQCNNESGQALWSVCYPSNDVSKICLDEKCVENWESDFKGWMVYLDFDGLDFDVVNHTDLHLTIWSITGIGWDEMTSGTVTDKKGLVKRIVVFCKKDDERVADSIAESIERKRDLGVTCDIGYLCKVKTVSVHNTDQVSRASTVHGVIETVTLLVLVFALMTALF